MVRTHVCANHLLFVSCLLNFPGPTFKEEKKGCVGVTNSRQTLSVTAMEGYLCVLYHFPGYFLQSAHS